MKITKDDIDDIFYVGHYVNLCPDRFIYERPCSDGQVIERQVIGKTPKGKNKTKDVLVDCSRCKGTGYKLNSTGEAFLNLIENLVDIKNNKKVYLPIKTRYDGY